MSLSKTASLLLASAALVAGHGYVSSIDVAGTTYAGYLVDIDYYETDPPELIAWSTNATDDGYVSPTDYASSNIVCHKGSAPGALSAPIAPGGSVTLTWSTWPDDHHGPVITYLANCNGSCTDVEKVDLQFFKIDAGGLINDTVAPGTWASDELIADSYSRTLTIPTDIAAGEYVLRHEIIALHGAEDLDGAQNYPQCINLNVTGSGTATPSGTLGEDLYKDTDPGIYVDIWNVLSTYVIPGPTLYTAGSTATATAAAAATTTATTAAVTTAASASSAAAEAATTEAATTSVAAEAATTSVAAQAETTQAPSSSSSSQTAVTTAPTMGGSPSSGGHSGNGSSGGGRSGESSSEEAQASTTTSVASASSTTSSSASTTSGVLSGSCTDEGYWYCDAGSAFQRCVDGEWDASQSVADGTVCTAGISDTLTVALASRKRSTGHARRNEARGIRV
ncbi:endoglucanase-4 precursor [Penicillium verhagenii]|uniref:endoglucanase-4 precursor n=1 Tax=Penicillium verhagenii TaxID=1562060 RepID=UPI002545B7A2|nr:endoglucanase-4 precursor [Penicillium verhagenii]KAJ5930841.1 endoglucanase-4 precursor [Penicillium verhagenii]